MKLQMLQNKSTLPANQLCIQIGSIWINKAKDRLDDILQADERFVQFGVSHGDDDRHIQVDRDGGLYREIKVQVDAERRASG
jgi:hypothetical protein